MVILKRSCSKIKVPPGEILFPRDKKWRLQAQQGKLADAILSYVAANDYVTFIEIQKQFQFYSECEGEAALSLKPNVILWADMSEPLANMLHRLLATDKLFLHPADFLTYVCQGGQLRLPLANRIPEEGYPEPCWLPTVLRTMPYQPSRGGSDEKE